MDKITTRRGTVTAGATQRGQKKEGLEANRERDANAQNVQREAVTTLADSVEL
jgi:hypothetical protein